MAYSKGFHLPKRNQRVESPKVEYKNKQRGKKNRETERERERNKIKYKYKHLIINQLFNILHCIELHNLFDLFNISNRKGVN